MRAKEYLKQAFRLYDLIQANKDELKELEALSFSIPGTDYTKDRVQSSPRNDASYTNIIAKIDELERVIKADINAMLTLKFEIREVINNVRDNEERLVLKYRYLNFLSWEEIAIKMNISLRTVFRIHGSALNHVVIPE